MLLDKLSQGDRPKGNEPTDGTKRGYDIEFVSREPNYARIMYLANPYWELPVTFPRKRNNEPLDDESALKIRQILEQNRKNEVTRDTPGAIRLIKIHVRFEYLLRGDELGPLELSRKYRYSREADSDFAKLLAALFNLRSEDIKTTDLELNDLRDRLVLVSLKPNKFNKARIDTITAVPATAAPVNFALVGATV